MPKCCSASLRLIGRFSECGVDMLLITLSTSTTSVLLTIYIFIFQISKSGGKVRKDWLKMPGKEHRSTLGQSTYGWNKLALLEILSDIKAIDEGAEENQIHSLSESEAILMRHKLKGLYSFLSQHPALLRRRLYVASQIPNDTTSETLDIQKKSLQLDIAQPACPSTSQWKLLFSAKDINDTVVEVFQPRFGSEGQQWFYTVTCNNNAFKSRRACPGCCIGIDHANFASSCRPKSTYVMALVRKPWDTLFDWNWIQVETSCTCAITPKSTTPFG